MDRRLASKQADLFSAAACLRGYGGLGFIAIATFALYFVFGLHYVSHNAERLNGSADLTLRNEAYLKGFYTWDTDFEGDDAYYNRTALGVMRTGMPRDRQGALGLHAPLYSYFIAACYAIGGVNRFSIAVAQSAAAALLACFAGLAAGRLAPEQGPRARWLGAGLILVNLLLAKWAASVNPTLLLLACFSIGLYCAAGPLEMPGVLGLAIATSLGVFIQAAFFVVASGVALWFAWLCWRQKKLRFLIGCGLVGLGVGMYLSLAAVAARAGATARANKTLILWEANNPYYESMGPFSLWGKRPFNPWSNWKASLRDQERYDAYFERGAKLGQNPAVLWINENPGQYAKLCWIRLYTTLGPFTGMMSPRNRVISTFYWLLIVPAGLCGLWQLRRSPFARLALMVFGTLTAFEVLVITEWQLRYRLPWVLILTLSACVCYSRLASRFRGSRSAFDGTA